MLLLCFILATDSHVSWRHFCNNGKLETLCFINFYSLFLYQYFCYILWHQRTLHRILIRCSVAWFSLVLNLWLRSCLNCVQKPHCWIIGQQENSITNSYCLTKITVHDSVISRSNSLWYYCCSGNDVSFFRILHILHILERTIPLACDPFNTLFFLFLSFSSLSGH